MEKYKPDLNKMICVENISSGGLTYVSKRQNGYLVEWEKPGDKNYIELSELVNMRNADRRFFEEPWIRIREENEIDILKFLGVYKYYKSIIDLNNIEDIFKLPISKFKVKFSSLSKGLKETVAEMAANKIKNNKLDSIKIKNFIEKELNLDLSILIPKTKFKEG